MQANVPPSVAFVRPLVSRYSEIRNAEPIVGYYCLMLAVKQVLDSKLHTSDASVAEFATELMNTIEAMKNDESMLDNESARAILETDDASREYVLNFANTLFDRAEMATISLKVNKATAATFAAAAVFLGLEAVWSSIPPETTEKIKFAKFQAARILRAIKNGEDPNKLYETDLEAELNDEHKIESNETGQDSETKQFAGTDQNAEASQNAEAGLNEASKDSDADIGDAGTTSNGSNGSGVAPYSSASNDAAPDAPVDEEDIKLPEAPKDNPEGGISLPNAPVADLKNDISLPPAPNSTPKGNVSPPAPPAKPTKPAKAAPAIPAKPQPKLVAPKTPVQQSSYPPAQTPAQIIALTRSTGDAQKHAKYAISALNYDDVNTAISQLETALDILRRI